MVELLSLDFHLILESGEVVVCSSEHSSFTVSSDGKTVRFSPHGPGMSVLSDISSQVTYKHGNELQVHRVETLPHKLRKKYLLTYEFVQAVKARTPKVTRNLH